MPIRRQLRRVTMRARTGFRPMMLVATMAFGATMLLTGLALAYWSEASTVLSGASAAIGLAAMLTTVVAFLRPAAWRMATILLAAPAASGMILALVLVVAPVLSPHRSAFGSNLAVFGSAVVIVTACWLAFVVVALVQDKRRHGQGDGVQLDPSTQSV